MTATRSPSHLSERGNLYSASWRIGFDPGQPGYEHIAPTLGLSCRSYGYYL